MQRRHHPPPDPKFSELSPARQRLVRLLQALNYGRLHDLLIENGEPVFLSGLRVVRTVKLTPGAANEPPPQALASDFALRKEVVALLGHLDALGHGIVVRVDVTRGVPTFFELESEYDGQREGGR